jgi:hypothetical protein
MKYVALGSGQERQLPSKVSETIGKTISRDDNQRRNVGDITGDKKPESVKPLSARHYHQRPCNLGCTTYTGANMEEWDD